MKIGDIVIVGETCQFCSWRNELNTKIGCTGKIVSIKNSIYKDIGKWVEVEFNGMIFYQHFPITSIKLYQQLLKMEKTDITINGEIISVSIPIAKLLEMSKP